jgi:glycosyltransferase involved in cell wall biosynthesis
MSNKILFTLVIANYNREKFIDRAIRSCTGQLIFRTNYEIIVIDDASTDDSMKIIQEFKDELIIIKNKVNKGVGYASNVALQKSTGKYWMRVDSDDFINQYACSIMTSILEENNDIDFVYCDHYRVDMHGIKEEKVRLNSDDALYNHGAGVMFRTKILIEVGGYDEMLRNCEDYDLLLRLKKRGFKGYYLPVPLYRYYIHGNNITLNNERETYKKMIKGRHNV